MEDSKVTIIDHGAWIQATHMDGYGLSTRLTAHRMGNGSWSIYGETYRPFVTDYKELGKIISFASRTEAVAFLQNPILK